MGTRNPLSNSFSIVTAIKDGLSFFKETVPTILGQTSRNWEWIIIDDGSSEPIGDFIRTLADPRVRYFRNAVSIGQTRSLNFGIGAAKGNWIVRMDGDDLAHPKRMELTAEAIVADPGCELIFSDYEVIHEDGAFVAAVAYNPPGTGFYAYLQERNNPIAHATVAFKRLTPDGKLRLYDENLRNAQDYALWKEIRRQSSRPFIHIPVPLVKYRLVKQSLSVARAPEQKRELDAIRGGNTEMARKESASPSEIKGKAMDGMYAFRVLYYRFIGNDNGPGKILPLPSKQDMALAWKAAFYPSVGFKSVIYALGMPLSGLLKKILFHHIFK